MTFSALNVGKDPRPLSGNGVRKTQVQWVLRGSARPRAQQHLKAKVGGLEGRPRGESGVSATGFPITLEENVMQRPGCLVVSKGPGPPPTPAGRTRGAELRVGVTLTAVLAVY